MVKRMLIILILIFINGCGEKQTELAPKADEVNQTTVQSEATEPSNVVVEATTLSEFVPAHIANSTIEVVPH
jgi:PBP1b-binding outer membrane lipoprotein LpoB